MAGLALLGAVRAGSASALLLILLDCATRQRKPTMAGVADASGGSPYARFYLHFGQDVEAGNNLLIDEIHDPWAPRWAGKVWPCSWAARCPIS